MEKHLENANEILQKEGQQLSRRLMNEIRTIKKLKMTTMQYINSTRERKRILEERLQQELQRTEVLKLRYKFNHNPSIQTIENNSTKKLPNVLDTEKYYKNLYKKEEGNKTTPVFNKWLRKMKKYSKTQQCEEQLQPNNIKEKIEAALRKTAPGKPQEKTEYLRTYIKYYPRQKDT